MTVKYFANGLTRGTALIYRVTDNEVRWYSFDQETWVLSTDADLSFIYLVMEEVSEKQVLSYLYMRELVS